MSESSEPIQSLTHGILALDCAALLLTQVTRSAAPLALIRAVTLPIAGLVAETQGLLDAGCDVGDENNSLDGDDVEQLEMGLDTVSDLADGLVAKLDAGESHWSLYCLADALRETTREMMTAVGLQSAESEGL